MLINLLPKKKKGFRKILIENQTYNWRFIGVIQIRPEQNNSNKIEIDFGYYDTWLYVNDKENTPEDFEPKIVTPTFVKKSIENAIKLGWDIKDKNKTTKLKYRNEIFENIK